MTAPKSGASTDSALLAIDFHPAVFDSLPAMVWIIDAGGRLIYENSALQEFNGPSPEARTNALELVHPDDRAHRAAALDKALREQSSFVLEFRCRRVDGAYRWVFDHCSPLRNRAGEFTGIIGFGYDITDRREADLALRDTAEEIQLLSTTSREMVWSWDARTGRVLHNRALAARLGEAPSTYDDALNWWRNRVHPEDLAQVERQIQATLRTGSSDGSYEYRLRDHDGAYITIDARMSLMRDADGNIVRVLGAMRDISLRKRAEEAQARLVRILEAGNDFVSMATPNGCPLYISPRGREMIGLPAGEPLTMHVLDFHPAWAREILKEEAFPTVLREGYWKGETALLACDGREIPVSQVILSHPGADGTAEFLSTIIRDLSDRKREEIARMEWANRYDAAIRASDQLLFDWNSTTNEITYAGDAERLLGYSMREMSGGLDRFRALIHPDDLPGFDEAIQAVTVTRDPFRTEFRVLCKNHGYVDIAAKGYFFLDRQGGIGRMVGFLADITAQKAAQTELARAHENLELRVQMRTAELARANAVIQDRALQQEAVAHIGQRALSGTDMTELMNEATALVRTVLKVDITVVFELDVEKQQLAIRSGAGIPAEISWNFAPETSSLASYTVAIGEPVVVEDLSSETRFDTRRLREEFGGVSSATVVIGSPERPFGVLGVLSKTERHFDLDEVHFLQSLANILTATMDRQRAEESIRLAREQAEAANRAKSDFLSRISHELRTPLNAILGFTQLLELEEPNASQAESIDHISRAGRHLLSLINEVLDIARIESGRLTLTPEAIEIDPFVREVVDLIRPLATRFRVQTQIATTTREYVLADRKRLQQVLLNLLSNAVKYNREDGAVTVTWEATAEQRVRISVADTGRGIEPEKMSLLFVPFERLGAEASDIEGSGIGLALSRAITVALDAELEVQSEVGKGSIFSVLLPRASSPAPVAAVGSAERADHPAPAQGGERPKLVLYIEDQDLNLRLVERILNPRPEYRLLTAMQGGIGLDLAREHRPDLILLDLNLPDMLGDEVLRRIKADPAIKHIPVIMVSADAMGDRIERVLALGATSYLTKPYRISEFLRMIQEALTEPA